MARIISFQDSINKLIDGLDDYCRRSGFTSINLETVQGMSSDLHGYARKKVKVKLSFWDKLNGYDDFYVVDDKSRPIYELTFHYKNHRQLADTFYFDKEEFERVRAELARYGWKIF